METGIKSLDGIEEASIDFVSKKLRIKAAEDIDIKNIIQQITAIVKGIESNVILIGDKSDKQKRHSNDENGDIQKDENDGDLVNKSEIIKFAIGAALYIIAAILKLSIIFMLFTRYPNLCHL
jgi:Cd2+/Zn2+-exporting ATPase